MYKKIKLITDAFYNFYNDYINLCACSSYPFPSTLKANSVPIYVIPTEGVVGKRYFPDITFIDEIEVESEKILLKLFNTTKNDYSVSIQPHSGTQANQIVYNAILKEKDVVLALSAKDGGHISHTKIAGKGNKVFYYHLDENFDVNYNEIEELCQFHHPKLVIVGTSSYSKAFDFQRIAKIAHKYDSLVLADICHYVLFILGKTMDNCIPFVDFVTFTPDKLLRGPQGGMLLYKNEFKKSINYSIFPLSQGGPLQSVLFSKFACLSELERLDLSKYARNVLENTNLLANQLIINNIPVFYDQIDNHIILLNVSRLGLTGLEAEERLFKGKILCNKNQIPNDKKSINNPSGIRIGCTCITNLGYEKNDIVLLANYISRILISDIYNLETIDYLTKKYKPLISPVR